LMPEKGFRECRVKITEGLRYPVIPIWAPWSIRVRSIELEVAMKRGILLFITALICSPGMAKNYYVDPEDHP